MGWSAVQHPSSGPENKPSRFAIPGLKKGGFDAVREDPFVFLRDGPITILGVARTWCGPSATGA